MLRSLLSLTAFARPRLHLAPRMASAADALGGPEIAVLGGGFGGLYTALRLCSLDWSGGPAPRVTLVDRSDRFAFSPMLYELATGTATSWEVSPRYEDLLAGTQVEFVRAEVCGLDEAERVVTLRSGTAERQLPYDQCVLAFGLQPRTDAVPGVSEHALTFHSAEDALELKKQLALTQHACRGTGTPLRIGIIGGGYVGVELAANLASALSAAHANGAPAPRVGRPGSCPPSSTPPPQITLVHRSEQLLPGAQPFSRDEARRRLQSAGVELRLGTRVVNVTPEAISLVPTTAPDGAPVTELPVDLTIWSAGMRPSSVVPGLPLPLDARGRILADATLRVRGHPRLFALGDAAAVVDARRVEAPPTAQAAMQQADYVAWNVRAVVRGEALLPFRYENLGEMLSLGDQSATIAALAQAVRLNGPVAYAVRRAVYAARMPTSTQAAKVGLSWAVDAAFGAMRKAAQLPDKRK